MAPTGYLHRRHSSTLPRCLSAHHPQDGRDCEAVPVHAAAVPWGGGTQCGGHPQHHGQLRKERGYCHPLLVVRDSLVASCAMRML
jgi:hypothetical protein